MARAERKVKMWALKQSNGSLWLKRLFETEEQCWEGWEGPRGGTRAVKVTIQEGWDDE